MTLFVLLAYYVGFPLCIMFTNLLCMIPVRWIVLFCQPSFGLVNCGIAPVHFLETALNYGYLLNVIGLECT